MQRLELLQDYCHHYFLKTIVSVAVISSQLELEKCRNGRKPDIPGVQNCHDSLTHTQAASCNPRLALCQFRALCHVVHVVHDFLH